MMARPLRQRLHRAAQVAGFAACAAVGGALAADTSATGAPQASPIGTRAANADAAAGPGGETAIPSLQASEPRAYGYQVGDRVQRELYVHAPAGWTLDESSLPRPGGRGQALELRRVDRQQASAAGGVRHELRLEYQVFLAPAAVRTLEIAPLRLRLDGPGRSEELLVEAWPVTVAPLVPALAPSRRGLGELQPDREPPRVDTDAARNRLMFYAAGAALLLAALAVQTFGWPWRGASARPFGRAWRSLRRLPAEPGEAEWRAACRDFHTALNQHAGAMLFEAGLAHFIAERPAFAALHDELLRFMRASRASFFAGAPHAPGDAAWLAALARRCHDAERGLS